MKAGDVLRYSWGYDQTNVEFFQVARATAKSVWLQPIGSKLEPAAGCGPMSGRVVADPTAIKSSALVGPKKINASPYGDFVSMPHGIAKVWDGKPAYTSWYA